jgi:hypothetical protein
MRTDRDYRLFMTGVVTGIIINIVAQHLTLPWFVILPLTVYGVYVLFDLGRSWVRAARRPDAESLP